MSQVIQTFVNGLALGGVYALTTLGLVIVFGIMRLINFAYAELIMAGGYALWIFTSFGMPWLAALGMAIVVTTLLAVLMERLAFRPLRDASAATLLIASFAVSSFLQRFVEVYIWPRPIAVQIPAIFSQTYELGGVRIPKVDILSILVTAVGSHCADADVETHLNRYCPARRRGRLCYYAPHGHRRQSHHRHSLRH